MGDAGGRDLRILCVEVDPDLQVIFELALSLDQGVEAKVVAGAEAALIVLANDPPFDVVLLDARFATALDMPLLDHILKSDGSPPTPVILMTTVTHRDHVARSGIIGSIEKPFNPIRLAGDVRRLLQTWG